MTTKNYAKPSVDNAKEVVSTFLNALNNEDFRKARSFLNDNMVFEGVLGHRDNADTYIKDIGKMKFKYRIRKIFEDENDVSVFYDIEIAGKKIFTSGWYRIKNKKINTIKVVFDPRPLFDQP